MNLRIAPVILVSLVLFALSGDADGELTPVQVSSLFEQANEAFRQANSATDDTARQKLYDKAVLSFERIINEGRIENAKLYYNLGNVYFLKGDIGKAILNYRRAEKLDGTDSDIQKNLAFARSRRIDEVKVKTEERVLQTLFFWHYDFSTRTRFVLACIFFAIVCISITVMIWFGARAAARVTSVIGTILAVCFISSVVVETRAQARRICGVITAKQVTAHQADWRDSAPSFKEPLHAGTEFDLIERRTGWFHIKLSDNSDGWITDNAAELI